MKVAAFAVFSAVSLYAQVERASIVGTITDRSGAAVPDVQVMVTHEGLIHRQPHPARWAASTGAQHVVFCAGSQHTACSSAPQHGEFAFAAFAAKNV